MTIVKCRDCDTRHDGPQGFVAHMRSKHMCVASLIEFDGITITVSGLPGPKLDAAQTKIWATIREDTTT